MPRAWAGIFQRVDLPLRFLASGRPLDGSSPSLSPRPSSMPMGSRSSVGSVSAILMPSYAGATVAAATASLEKESHDSQAEKFRCFARLSSRVTKLAADFRAPAHLGAQLRGTAK